ncbi:hypothetical protein KUV57_11120 [Epibacterium sp. DP7N7-1]|nr:hypothetical protein [Epibacterium sp. DP7N7-1]
MSHDRPETTKLTRLEEVERARMEAIVDSMRKALPESLQVDPEIDKALAGLAEAAVEAFHQYPKGDYPFGRDLNVKPDGVHGDTLNAIDQIDAGIFSGDSFMNEDPHLYLAAYVQRWSKALTLARRDDWFNRLEDQNEEQDFEL